MEQNSEVKLRKLSFKDFVPIIFKLIVIVGAIVGVFSTAMASGFMSSSAFLFFTVQSNITIAVMCLIFLVFNVLSLVKGEEIVVSKWLYCLKFLFTVAITLTFLVFSLMLTPNMIINGQAWYLASASNVFCHNIVPIFSILDFLFYDYKYKSAKYAFLLGATMPLYYMTFALIGSVTGVDFGGGAKVPYFFFDYEANSWFQIGNGKFGTFWWIIILVIVVLGMSWVFIWAKNKIAAKKLGK